MILVAIGCQRPLVVLQGWRCEEAIVLDSFQRQFAQILQGAAGHLDIVRVAYVPMV